MVHQPPPITRKLPEAIGLGERRWLAGVAPSPRGWKNRDVDGVGLGIAVALEKAGSESPRKLHATTLIAIGSPRTDGPKGRPDMCGLGCSGRHSESLRSGERAQGGELRRKVGAGSFCLSPPPAVPEDFRVADFLSNCYLCRKKLDGKDIFMYREKAFCSMECRYRQIVTDEYQEKLGVETPKRSPEIASSPYSGGQLFFTGIVVS